MSPQWAAVAMKQLAASASRQQPALMTLEAVQNSAS